MIEEKIREKECIPDHSTLVYLLEEGKIDIVAKLIENIYLPNEIDPTDSVNSWIGKTEARLRQVNQVLQAIDYKKLTPHYSYINYDNKISMVIKIYEESLVPEKLFIHCYKNMIVFNTIFQKKGERFVVSDKKYLFDEVDGECEYNYNSYGTEIEITINKKNKYKKWDSLFKKN